jgi:hypothetical protein
MSLKETFGRLSEVVFCYALEVDFRYAPEVHFVYAPAAIFLYASEVNCFIDYEEDNWY